MSKGVGADDDKYYLKSHVCNKMTLMTKTLVTMNCEPNKPMKNTGKFSSMIILFSMFLILMFNN